MTVVDTPPRRAVVAYRLKLRALSDLSVGGSLAELTPDAPDQVVARVGERPAILGSALAGVLRARLDEGTAVALFGGGDPRSSQPSKVVVYDHLASPTTAIAVRDGVAIDRRTSAAHENLKFDREVVEAGTELEGWISLRDPLADADAGALRALESLIGTGAELSLGAGSARGAGRVQVVACTRWAVRPDASAHARLFGDPWECSEVRRDGDGTPRRAERVEHIPVTLHGRTPVLSTERVHGDDEMATSAIKIWPTVTVSGDQVRLVVRGSAVRGVLRSAAEVVVRTVLDRPLHWVLHESVLVGQAHAAQIDLPLVSALFGSGAHRGRQRPHKGAVAVTEARSVEFVAVRRWNQLREEAARVQAAGGHASGVQLDDVLRKRGWRIDHHVAIDRWTGGSADGKLYTLLRPPVTDWTFRLEIDETRLRRNVGADARLVGSVEDRAAAARVLLALALELLHRGDVRLGWGAQRGFGRVEVADWPRLAARIAPRTPQDGWVSVLGGEDGEPW